MTDDQKAAKQAFDKWFDALPVKEQMAISRSSCWIGFLAGASHGVQTVSKIIAETLT